MEVRKYKKNDNTNPLKCYDYFEMGGGTLLLWIHFKIQSAVVGPALLVFGVLLSLARFLFQMSRAPFEN